MIIDLIVSLFAVAGFGLVLWMTGIAAVAHSAIDKAAAGISAMLDADLGDDEKEIAVRRAGFGLIRTALGVFARFALALAAAAAPIYAAAAIGLTSSNAVLALMMRLDYIVIVSVLAIVAVEIVRRSRARPSPAEHGPNRYSATDQFLHNLAFSSPAILKTAAWMEDRMISGQAHENPAAPIFVTSLARGGTTAVLNALSDVPTVATHLYRDMPFMTAPALWNRLSGGSRRNVERHQRAHGDGLEIDLDTPEAFEEVIWKMYWPEKFRDRGIDLWSAADHRPNAERFLRDHMAKIVHARSEQSDAGGPRKFRYCSKNNANIGRIAFLQETFDGCKIVVPVRRPQTHAASLLRQHRNFLKQQADDDFVRRYMRDIGHFEFGQIHKPLLFPGFDPGLYDPATENYWLNYWIRCFQHVLAHRDACIFVLQDDLRAKPQATMEQLCGMLSLEPADINFRNYFLDRPDKTLGQTCDSELLDLANDVYIQFEDISRRQNF